MGPLLWAGVLVGLAFQAKMLQAWLVLPAFSLAYLIAAPVRSLFRRIVHVSLSAVVTIVVSLSWMTAVTLVPSADRPYADGSCNNSVFSQVFSYNGLARLGGSALGSHAGCHRPSTWVVTLAHYSAAQQISTASINPAWDRLLHGPFGHDGAWLLLPALVSAVALLVVRRHEPRTDRLRAAVVLWSTWLVVLFGFFSAGRLINSYYVAALVPAIAALCAMGARLAWQRRHDTAARVILAATVAASVAVTVALIPGYVGLRAWIIASTVGRRHLGGRDPGRVARRPACLGVGAQRRARRRRAGDLPRQRMGVGRRRDGGAGTLRFALCHGGPRSQQPALRQGPPPARAGARAIHDEAPRRRRRRDGRDLPRRQRVHPGDGP